MESSLFIFFFFHFSFFWNHLTYNQRSCYYKNHSIVGESMQVKIMCWSKKVFTTLIDLRFEDQNNGYQAHKKRRITLVFAELWVIWCRREMIPLIPNFSIRNTRVFTSKFMHPLIKDRFFLISILHFFWKFYYRDSKYLLHQVGLKVLFPLMQRDQREFVAVQLQFNCTLNVLFSLYFKFNDFY